MIKSGRRLETDVHLYLIACGTGAALGWVAWGPGRSPVLAVMVPILVALMPSMRLAWLAALCYHLAVLRFLPAYASHWFSSMALGWGCYLACCAGATVPWALMKLCRRKEMIAAAPFLALLPPFAAVFPGNPLVGWGFLLPGMGWLGLVCSLLVTIYGIRLAVGAGHSHTRKAAAFSIAVVALAAISTFTAPGQEEGRVAGSVLAVNTKMGPPPKGDEETTSRIEEIGRIVRTLANNTDFRSSTLVFPETALGQLDESFRPALREAVLRPAMNAGINLVMGVEQRHGQHSFNGAFVFRADGTSGSAVQRQPALASMWQPWLSEGHFPADWTRDTLLDLGSGVKARMIVCYEQFLPGIFLLDELRGGHSLTLVLANSWAADDELGPEIQRAHTIGMARMFNRHLVLAENRPRP